MSDATLPSPEQRMLASLARLDQVDAAEALRRAVRLAFFARTVPEALVQAVLGEGEPDAGWSATGEIRVSEHGDLVAERRTQDGASKWVPATQAEIDAYFSRKRDRVR